MLTTKPRGTSDITPSQIDKWHFLEQTIKELCQLYLYQEIRTPIFEHTELFLRGVGKTTDIVDKEMYTFLDKGERSLSLRPEGTAAVVRAYIENKMQANSQPTKLYYLGPMFRYSRPAAGRYRQFHQFGVEVFGSQEPSLDADVIAFSMHIFQKLGLKNLTLQINSVGCEKCRPVHKTKLLAYLEENFAELCPTCQERFAINPLRIFDCKNQHCQELTLQAPTITQCLCSECDNHLKQVEKYLQVIKLPYILDEHLVRGLDYYTKTAFEISVEGIGSGSSIGGGGRYDRLVEECGGAATPGIGFAIGLERVLLALEEQKVSFPAKKKQKIFVINMDEQQGEISFLLLQNLRAAGLVAEKDFLGRSFKNQLKYANKEEFAYVIIIGEEEIETGNVPIKDMTTGTQTVVAITDVVEYLKRLEGA